MYLVYFFRFARSFLILARVIPSVARTSFKTGSYIRYSLFIMIASTFLGAIFGVSLPYISSIMIALSYGLLISAYYNLALTFKSLREQNLYPKKESKILLYSQTATTAAMIPITIGLSLMVEGASNDLIPLVIGAVTILLGTVGLLVGLLNLSRDAHLIEGPSDVNYVHEPSTVYSPIQQQTYTPGHKKIDPVRTISEEEQIKTKPKDGEMVALFCPNCGNKLKENKAFCHNCGAKVEDF